LLDRKLSQQQEKIDYLLTTAETLVKEKETQARKLVRASEELTKLSKRYVDNEKITNQLRKHNNELKSMLNSLDGKGKQIAGLAKEKVKSYQEKNQKLQDEMETLKHELDFGKESMGTNIKVLETTLTATCSDILAQVANLVQKENLDDKGQGELAKIQDRLKSLEQAKLDLSGSIEAAASREATELKSQLETKTAEMSKQHADLASQIELLKQENLNLKQEADASPQGQGQVGDNRDTEALLGEIKGKDEELEKVRAELSAIRALVLGSMGAGTQVSK
jgi:chromosome segregation ATPase